MNKSKIALLAVIVALIAAFFAFDLGQYFHLEYFRSRQEDIQAYYRANPGRTMAIYFAIYVSAAALSLPGAVVLTLAGGAIFGLVAGTVIVSFASSIGATLAFLVSRFALRDWVQARFGDQLKPVNDGFRKDGPFYLFALRLVHRAVQTFVAHVPTPVKINKPTAKITPSNAVYSIKAAPLWS